MRYLFVVVLSFCFMSCDDTQNNKDAVSFAIQDTPQWVTDKDCKDGHFHGVAVQKFGGKEFAQVVEEAQRQAKVKLLEQLRLELKKTSREWSQEASKIEDIAFDESYFIDASQKVLSTVPEKCSIIQEVAWKDMKNKAYWIMLTVDYKNLSDHVSEKLQSFSNRIFPKGLKASQQKLSDAEIRERKKRVLAQGVDALNKALKNLHLRRGGKS